MLIQLNVTRNQLESKLNKLGWVKYNETPNFIFYSNGDKVIKVNKNKPLIKLVVTSILIEAERQNGITAWTRHKNNIKSLSTGHSSVTSSGTKNILDLAIFLGMLALMIIIASM